MSDQRAWKHLRGVVVDFFGTVARHPQGAVSGLAAVFERHGYSLDPRTEADHARRYEGIEHREHSLSADTYEAWIRRRHTELATADAVSAQDMTAVVDALMALSDSPLVAYPDAAPVLRTLRNRGFRVGVCSNWGWDLESSLRQAGLFDLVDVAVTSAQAGARKPHPRIFAVLSEAMSIGPEEILFVGDSLRPDVDGSIAAGMSAVHLHRPEDASGPAPALPAGALRVGSLSELLDWEALAAPLGAPLAPG